MTDAKVRKWDEDHHHRCSGKTERYILGYEFNADALVMPIAPALIPKGSEESFVTTLGSVFVAGATEILEVEPDEIAFLKHPTGTGGYEIVFYETIPGGAGYLRSLAGQLQDWATASAERLFNHDCAKACYRCLKTYRNQFFHHLLDKDLVRDALFQFSCGEQLGPASAGQRRQGIKQASQWICANAPTPTKDTPIELKLLEAIQRKGRLPEPTKQKEIKKGDILLTIPDFAYEAEKIAIFCDGFAYHGSKDMLASDSQKRNELQADGWAVLTFWGKTILEHPNRCEQQIWLVWTARHSARARVSGGFDTIGHKEQDQQSRPAGQVSGHGPGRSAPF
jgi:very-short-patch-repair endonuclease